jgi:hypothetical protein
MFGDAAPIDDSYGIESPEMQANNLDLNRQSRGG